jgi:hypothetical protein
MLAIHNLSRDRQSLSIPIKKPVTSMTDLLTQNEFIPVEGNIMIELMPYQNVWLK